MSDDDDLDDIMSSVGLGTVDVDGLPPEEQFLWEQTKGGAARMDNTRIWLMDKLNAIISLQKDSDCYIVSRKTQKWLKMPEIARELLRHYYYMYHFARFSGAGATPSDNTPICNMDTYLDLVCQEESIKKTIDRAVKELDT